MLPGWRLPWEPGGNRRGVVFLGDHSSSVSWSHAESATLSPSKPRICLAPCLQAAPKPTTVPHNDDTHRGQCTLDFRVPYISHIQADDTVFSVSGAPKLAAAAVPASDTPGSGKQTSNPVFANSWGTPKRVLAEGAGHVPLIPVFHMHEDSCVGFMK
jgi:hypothetical protein